MPSLILQAGHHPSGGGAPGEASWTMRCASWLHDLLIGSVSPINIVGDWYGRQPPSIVRHHHDLALFLHYDAAIYGAGNNTGAFGDRYRQALSSRSIGAVAHRMRVGSERVDDQTIEGHLQAILALTANPERLPRQATTGARSYDEDRFIQRFELDYGTLLPIKNERRNPNTYRYYGYAATPATTPSVLIECGVGAPVGTGGFPAGQDADLLHNHLDLVVGRLARAVLAFFDLPLPDPPPPPPTPEDPMLFTDAELDAYLRPKWEAAGLDYNPDAGTVKAWKKELREGRWRGFPKGGEIQFHDGLYMEFDHGTVFYRYGQFTWTG